MWKTPPAPAVVAPIHLTRPTASVAAHEAQVNQFIAAYIMGIANRLATGASHHYRTHHHLGMAEWRAMMAIGHSDHRIVREVAQMADLDYAAASKSLRVLERQGLVAIEQTRSRGRASIACLTPLGLQVYERIQRSARERQDRLLAPFSAQEVETLWTLLRKLESQIGAMNVPD